MWPWRYQLHCKLFLVLLLQYIKLFRALYLSMLFLMIFLLVSTNVTAFIATTSAIALLISTVAAVVIRYDPLHFFHFLLHFSHMCQYLLIFLLVHHSMFLHFINTPLFQLFDCCLVQFFLLLKLLWYLNKLILIGLN